jgi:uncharacterized protein (DUF736 family)
MKKRIIEQQAAVHGTRSPEQWLNLEGIAQVELASEHPDYPIESALALEGKGDGWRAAKPGEQFIRILFDAPTAISRIRLQFNEARAARTQEFVLRWAHSRSEPLRDIVRQQWTFSPDGSTSEVEDYRVNLAGVGVLELALKPDISGGDTPASLAAWRIA